MPATLQKHLSQLRNTRDLRAEMLALAAEVVKLRVPATLVLVDPKVQPDTAREEWDRLLPALDAEVRALLELRVQKASAGAPRRARPAPETWLVELERPNYRYEVVRLLLAAYLEDDGPQSVNGIVENIGASQTPVRQALAALRAARVGHYWNPGVDLQADEVSLDVLARINALPSTLRFRFAQGSQIKPPARLLERALQLLASSVPGWSPFSLSGVTVAQQECPALDLAGLPRLDLTAHVPRTATTLDVTALRMLDDGLELESSVLAPAPVVITLVRAEHRVDDRDVGWGVRTATTADVFLALLDLGLRAQALQYTAHVRRQA